VTNVLVGVHVHALPSALTATLASLEADSSHPFELLLLPDGPDEGVRALLATLDAAQDGTADPRGAAACFNRLARASSADVVVLLESGSVVGPGWLSLLLAALAADPRNGLAGPSTNLSWNEQAAFPRADDVAAAAAEAAARFGAETRTLEPLHSLADFCYAVRRPVLELLGGADEGYGLGPCWEMEYSARAARAGFRAVWACGAYVHRTGFTPRRRHEESRMFDASRRRYQDAVCGLQLRGERSGYEAHCRGEACEHFAPLGLIRIHRPLAVSSPQAPAAPRREVALASCIMPTGHRSDFALQAVQYFQRQDYEPRELVIVDDGDDSLERLLPEDSRIRYLRAPAGEPIGTKRNRACAAAGGAFVVHWDDDDWFAPERLRRQLEPLLDGQADITALRADVFFDLERWKFWRCSPELHRRLFVEDVHGGTLAYRRELWTSGGYPALSLAEDAWFLRKAVRGGARLLRLANDGLFVYLRHGSNAWRFACGNYLDAGEWRPADEPLLPAEDRAFYAARSPAAPAPPLTLVSCIMPTADRRHLVEQSIRYFLRQDYPSRELIVLDDGDDRVEDLVPDDARIRYVGLERRLVLGAKRNRGCELARGDVIVHWDDDDWMAPHRLRYEIEELERHGADVCGASRQLYFDPARRAAWLYAYPEKRRAWVAGNTLCYAKETWRKNPFAEIAIGEDTRFIWSRAVDRLLQLEDHRFQIGLVHDANTSRKHTGDPWWHPARIDEVTTLLGDDAAFYLAGSPFGPAA
jgi:glycosyltransferase involved in cell wall biosynthesis/GT2 family glycosyltransferase